MTDVRQTFSVCASVFLFVSFLFFIGPIVFMLPFYGEINLYIMLRDPILLIVVRSSHTRLMSR